MVLTPEGEMVCTRCGCTEAIPGSVRSVTGTHEATDPHSFDNGLGSEPLRTIQELRFNSRLLLNTWQVVLGYYKHGVGNAFVEGCLRDLAIALDGATDEQFLQCRRLMLKEIRAMTSFKELGPSRKKARQVVVGRTLEQAALAWPRIATLLRNREATQRELSKSSSSNQPGDQG